MTKANQLILYNHFIKTVKDGASQRIKENAQLHADSILKSFPDFKVKEVKPVEEEVKPKGKKK